MTTLALKRDPLLELLVQMPLPLDGLGPKAQRMASELVELGLAYRMDGVVYADPIAAAVARRARSIISAAAAVRVYKALERPMTAVELARALGMDESKVKRALALLIEAGLAEKVEYAKLSYYRRAGAGPTEVERDVLAELCEFAEGAKGRIICKLAVKIARRLRERKAKYEPSWAAAVVRAALLRLGLQLLDADCAPVYAIAEVCNRYRSA